MDLHFVTDEGLPRDVVGLVSATIIKDALAAALQDPWPCIVDEAFRGNPNKKLIRFGGEHYVLDIRQIPW